MNKKWLLITSILIAVSFGLQAQNSPPAMKYKFESRIGASISADFLDKSLGISFSPEIRSRNEKYDKTLLKLEVDYDLLNILQIGLGGRIIFNETKKGTETGDRFDVDVSRNFDLWRLRIKPRIRYSMKFEPRDNVDKNFRYKVELSYKHCKKALFEPEVAYEMYHMQSSRKIEVIRYSAGGNFRINKRNYIEVMYLLDTELRKREIIQIAKINYKYKF